MPQKTFLFFVFREKKRQSIAAVNTSRVIFFCEENRFSMDGPHNNEI